MSLIGTVPPVAATALLTIGIGLAIGVVSAWQSVAVRVDDADAQARAFDADPDNSGEAGRRARSQTRAWGRFTRNFVVQGTAAEWALCWIASIRRRLWALGEAEPSGRAPAPFDRRPHLVFFLHDEVVVHAPADQADAVVGEVRAAAAEAGRLLFGDFPVSFPLSVTTVETYADAK
jgi:DNA polymerase-1